MSLPSPTSSSAVYNAANELTQWNGVNLTYDTNGNLTGDGLNNYTWDERNQLATVKDANNGATLASFVYDPFGRRLQNSGGDQVLYDGQNEVQELSGTTPVVNRLTGGVDEFFSRTDSAGTTFPLTDALGSTIALTDSTGTVQTQYTYDPFGGSTASGAMSTNTYQFTGRVNDGTGLYYYRARYYSPRFQRFISEDPAGFGSGPNLYAYVGNDPAINIDPSGLCTDPGGPGIRYCIDTFIPESSVWGFTGDARGPDPNGGTYRTQQLINENPDGTVTSQYDPGTSSLNLDNDIKRQDSSGGCGATPLAGRKNGVKGFHARCWASDGLGFGLAPDAGYDLNLAEVPGGPTITGMATKFPSLEIWQYGGANGPQLIYYYNSQAAGTGPSDLLPPGPLMPIVR